MRLSVLVFFAASIGCAGSADVGQGEAEATGGPASLDLALTIAESKIVFSSRVEAFVVTDRQAMTLPCRDRSFFMTSKPSLYDGWDPARADAFSEDIEGAEFREHTFASCRDASHEVLGWFGKERGLEFTVSEQLLDEDYDPKKLPVLLRLKTLGSDAVSHYSCDSEFKKTQIGETENAKRFEITATCKRRTTPAKGASGPVDFISAPGPYASLASYRDWMLPAVPSTQASFDRVRKALLEKVGAGSYGGAMRTLSSLCDLDIESDGDRLIVDHTIKSSDRTRHLELKAEDLLGFSEGALFDFEEPLRVGGEQGGTFVAAEFRDKKGDSFVLRFEQNTNREGQVMRINGSETFCRRLEKK
jgi:hypothetical protein